MTGAPDFAHAAFAEEFDHLVGAEVAGGLEFDAELVDPAGDPGAEEGHEEGGEGVGEPEGEAGRGIAAKPDVEGESGGGHGGGEQGGGEGGAIGRGGDEGEGGDPEGDGGVALEEFAHRGERGFGNGDQERGVDLEGEAEADDEGGTRFPTATQIEEDGARGNAESGDSVEEGEELRNEATAGEGEEDFESEVGSAIGEGDRTDPAGSDAGEIGGQSNAVGMVGEIAIGNEARWQGFKGQVSMLPPGNGRCCPYN